MGRRGYVVTRPAEYGNCVTDWAQDLLKERLFIPEVVNGQA